MLFAKSTNESTILKQIFWRMLQAENPSSERDDSSVLVTTQINVEDVNDHRPVFSEAYIRVSLRENSPYGTVVRKHMILLAARVSQGLPRNELILDKRYFFSTYWQELWVTLTLTG